jgi:PH/SEC7 domain-containing protein
VNLAEEELSLSGPPWAKEGKLVRKHYWESTGKRSKDERWSNVFVVVSKGEFKMFTFGEGADPTNADAIGGGNWLVSANGAPAANQLNGLL